MISDEWWDPFKHLPDPDDVVEVYIPQPENGKPRQSTNYFAKAKKVQGTKRRAWFPFPAGAQLFGIKLWRYPQRPAGLD